MKSVWKMKKFHFTSFGCKVNRYDGQLIVEEFERAGWKAADTAETADIIVVNCCVVTGRSAGKCRRTVRSLSRRNGRAPLLVTGCLTADDRKEIESIDPRIRTSEQGEGRELAGRFLAARPGREGVHGLRDRTRAYVKVQDGCDLCCSYCIIPSLRGPSRCRSAEEILSEVSRLLRAGYSELVLCGIRLGGFRDKDLRLDGLVDLILSRETGRFRLRLSSLNPAEATPALLDTMAGDDRVAPHLHLPLQSGDNATLRRMRRPYTAETFLKKLERLRAVLPDPAVSTDFMVGFPGEDDRSFQKSLDVLAETGASRVHVFPFSARPGTEAAAWPGVSEGDKKDRALEARSRAAEMKKCFDRAFLGREARILIEGNTTPPRGLTSRYQKVSIENAESKDLPAGTWTTAHLKKYESGIFTGRIKEDRR